MNQHDILVGKNLTKKFQFPAYIPKHVVSYDLLRDYHPQTSCFGTTSLWMNTSIFVGNYDVNALFTIRPWRKCNYVDKLLDITYSELHSDYIYSLCHWHYI